MPRLRTLKPGFFTNETLAELQPIWRLLFAGLWVLADKEGRLEDRPKRIEAELFPYEDVDVNVGLDALMQAGFITRYIVDGVRFIAVSGWKKHQRPHVKEAESTLPAPNEHELSGAEHEPFSGDTTEKAVPISLGSCLLSSVFGGGGGASGAVVAPAAPRVSHRAPSIVAKRRTGAAWEGTRVWVPNGLHRDICTARAGNETEVLAWYEAVNAAWTSGPKAADDPGIDMFAFWRARYKERWPSVAVKTDKRAQILATTMASLAARDAEREASK